MNRLTLALSMAAMVAFGCSGDGGGGGDEGDPRSLAVGEEVSGVHGPGDPDPFDPVSDHDYYAFTAPAAGRYTISLSGDPQAQVNECMTPEFCLCEITVPTCCTIADGTAACSFQTRPLAAGETTYLVTSNFGPAEASYSFRVTGPDAQ